MADGVAVVEQDADAECFALVLGDDVRLDSDAAANDVGGDVLLEGEQRCPVSLEICKKVGVEDEAVLDRLGPTGCEFALGEGLECADIGENEPGLVESADEVLALGQVNGGLAADSGVHHREQACGHLREGQATQVSRRHEAREIADDTASNCHYQVAALCLALGKPAIYELRGLQRLVRLACGHDEHVRGDACGFERELCPARLPVNSLVSDDVCGGSV